VLIEDAGLVWNAAFGGGPIVVPNDGQLPHRELDGGLTLTLWSPTPQQPTAIGKKFWLWVASRIPP
jgi:hypothetical protein